MCKELITCLYGSVNDKKVLNTLYVKIEKIIKYLCFLEDFIKEQENE